nr:HAMP domain-containing sensor histidine kinase [Arthrobacter sp. ok362]
MPLAVMMAGVALAGPAAWPGLPDSTLCRFALALQAALLAACVLVPWQRFGPLAPLVIPILDLVAIGLLRDGTSAGLPDPGVLSVLPVVWISASSLSAAASLSLSFSAPLLAALPWLLADRTAPLAARTAEAVLVPLMMLAVSLAMRSARARLRHEQRRIKSKEAELGVLLAEVTGLVDALAAKDDVVSTVSHEFRTPLTSIIGNLDLVLADIEGLDSPVVRRVEVAQRNAERLLALVSDLLMSASAAVHVHPRRTDLAGLVEASLGSAQAQAQASRVRLATDVPGPLWANVDPLRISQALDNLVSNAIKYSPDGGSVRVSASTADGLVRLHVEDTGMGMTAADAGRVFTRFFRSPAVRDGSIPGAGLGLSITKAIVERHGGSISCRTRPGHGSTFTLELPTDGPPAAF